MKFFWGDTISTLLGSWELGVFFKNWRVLLAPPLRGLRVGWGLWTIFWTQKLTIVHSLNNLSPFWKIGTNKGARNIPVFRSHMFLNQRGGKWFPPWKAILWTSSGEDINQWGGNSPSSPPSIWSLVNIIQVQCYHYFLTFFILSVALYIICSSLYYL